MEETLASTLANLNLNAQNLDGAAFDARIADEENGVYQSQGPRQRKRQTADELKDELETEFLSPSSKFSPDWLNRLQRCCLPFCRLLAFV